MMRPRLRIHFLLIAIFVGSWIHAAEYGKVSTKKVAEGVYLFQTTGYGDVGMSGNSVAILDPDFVVVFDTTGLPSSAQKIVEEIRKLTDKPVRYVINSHWHWDHWGGNIAFQQAFPGVQVIAQERTRRQMLEVEPRWNDEGLKVQLPAYIQSLEKTLADKKATGASQDIESLEELLQADRDFYNQKISLKKVYPDVTFSEAMDLYPAGQQIHLQHSRSITVGDTYVFLPAAKILITGDILLNPYPFAIGGSYPADWLKTLETFAELNPSLIVPGHGEPWADASVLQNYIKLFRSLMARVNALKASGIQSAQVQETISKEAPEFAAMIGITDVEKINEMRGYFLNVFVARACEELDHPLSDLPGGMK